MHIQMHIQKFYDPLEDTEGVVPPEGAGMD